MNSLYSLCQTCSMVVVLVAMGCERAAPPAAPANPDSGAAAASGSGTEVDWSKVSGADVTVAMDALCRLCRLADAHHKGKEGSVTIEYRDGAARDEAGHVCRVSPEEWKGIIELVSASNGGKAPARAQPASAKNYGDGLGSVTRFAYEAEAPQGPSKLRLTVLKPLNGESAG